MATKSTSPKSGLRQKAQLMSASEIERTLVRLAHEIVEKNNGVEGLGLVGIRRRGVPIAERLGKIIQRMEDVPIPVGTLDITFYRDDVDSPDFDPRVKDTDLHFDLTGKRVAVIGTGASAFQVIPSVSQIAAASLSWPATN